MSSYVNRWSALGLWAAVMGGLWIVRDPAVLSGSSLAVLAAAGPVLVIAASAVRSAHGPQSLRQEMVTSEASADVAARGRR
jgi:hypothetical protein